MRQVEQQPFFVMNDEAYERCMTRLQAGERYVKSYLHTCPHSRVEDCKCVHYLSFFKDGEMVRSIKGKVKKVVSETRLREHKDATMLDILRDAARRNDKEACSDTVRDYLDAKLPGWRDVVTAP